MMLQKTLLGIIYLGFLTKVLLGGGGGAIEKEQIKK